MLGLVEILGFEMLCTIKIDVNVKIKIQVNLRSTYENSETGLNRFLPLRSIVEHSSRRHRANQPNPKLAAKVESVKSVVLASSMATVIHGVKLPVWRCSGCNLVFRSTCLCADKDLGLETLAGQNFETLKL